jgi:hypothetical protein
MSKSKTPESFLSGAGIVPAKRRGGVDLTQNAPNKTAPTNANTAQTATTLRFNVARPTSVLPSSVERAASVTESRANPKREMYCSAANYVAGFADGQKLVTNTMIFRDKRLAVTAHKQTK